MSHYKIGLAALNVPAEARVYVQEVLQSGDIGQASPYLARFEEMLKAFTGARHAIVTNSGTMADAIAVAALKEKYNPRRVVVAALTFIAQPNAVYYNGLDVEFCDVTEEFMLNWNAARLHDTRTTLYFPSDCLGRVCEFQQDGTGERVIEDACEAFGSTWFNHKAGHFSGELGTFSFFASHTLTTGEGGAILTDDDYLAMLCRSLRSHGRASETDATKKFSFPRLGFNGKMSGLQAALGCGLMEHVSEYLERRRANYLLMQELLGGFKEREGEQIIPHAFPVQFHNEMTRNEALYNLLAAGIECRKFFSCLPTMEPAYAYKREPLGRYPVAEHIAFTYLLVPCHQNMTEADVRFVAEQVNLQAGRSRAFYEYPEYRHREYVLNA